MIIDSYINSGQFYCVVDTVRFQPGHYAANFVEYSRLYQGTSITHPNITPSTPRGTWLKDLGRGRYYALLQQCR
jgi:hypothetical protein